MNTLLLLVIAILTLALINVLVWNLRSKKSNQPSLKGGFRLENDLTALNAGAIGLGERLLKIERNQKRIAERLEQLELHNNTQSPYSQAINLAKRGLDKAGLMEACDISETEAGLLISLHKQSKSQGNQRH